MISEARRPVRGRELLAAASLGVLWFCVVYPPRILNPSNLDWLLSADRAEALVGWLFFRNEPWRLPLGSITSMVWPLQTTVALSDSIPWLATFFKIVLPAMAGQFQFFGIWLLGCFIAQAVFGLLLLHAWTDRVDLSLLGTSFLLLSPTLLGRYPHLSLCAHWQILAALWLYCRTTLPTAQGRVAVGWAGLTAIAASTHPYLAAMVVLIGAAAHVRYWFLDKSLSRGQALARVLGMTALCVGMWAVWGYWSSGASTSATGFGRYTADLLAFIDPRYYSAFLPALPTSEQQWEGNSYLGLGLLLLGAVAVVPLARLRIRRDTVWRYLPLIAVASAMLIFAIGTPVTLAGRPLFHVHGWGLLNPLPTVFRSSGRFIWPAYYLIVAIVFGGVALLPSARVAMAVTAVALGVQVLDLRPLLHRIHEDLDPPRTESPISPGFHDSRPFFDAVQLVPRVAIDGPMPFCYRAWGPADALIPFSLFAARERLRFNSAKLARWPVHEVAAACRAGMDSLNAGILNDRTIYIVGEPFAGIFAWWIGDKAVCNRLDGHIVCVARSNPSPLRAALSGPIQGAPIDWGVELDFTSRTKDNPAVRSFTGWNRPRPNGREMADTLADVRLAAPLAGSVLLEITASPTGSVSDCTLLVSVGGASGRLALPVQPSINVLRFDDIVATDEVRFSLPSEKGSCRTVGGAPAVRVTHMLIRLERRPDTHPQDRSETRPNQTGGRHLSGIGTT